MHRQWHGGSDEAPFSILFPLLDLLFTLFSLLLFLFSLVLFSICMAATRNEISVGYASISGIHGVAELRRVTLEAVIMSKSTEVGSNSRIVHPY